MGGNIYMMSSIYKEFLDSWVSDITEEEQPQDHIKEDNKLDILCVRLKPRIKWFKPPLWKIFMWAYKIEEATMYENCYPASISTDIDPSESNGEFKLEFHASKLPSNDKIDEAAGHMLTVIGGLSNAKISE